MKITIEITDKETKLIHTWIRRSIFEDYFIRIADCTMTEEQARNTTYDAIDAFSTIRNAIEEEWHK